MWYCLVRIGSRRARLNDQPFLLKDYKMVTASKDLRFLSVSFWVHNQRLTLFIQSR
jgi:hypothetical protein